MAGAAYLMMEGLEVSSLLTAVIVVLVGVGLTGGLHVDGFADTADAFFSYRDRLKRLEILEDPRIGAFGTIGLISLLLLKVALLYEWLQQVDRDWLVFILIPFLSRTAMNLYFTMTPPAKKSGIAAFFKERLAERKLFWINTLLAVTVLFSWGLLVDEALPALFVTLVIVVVPVLYRKWSMQHFGGVSGDLSGALIEGVEVLLWMLFLILR